MEPVGANAGHGRHRAGCGSVGEFVRGDGHAGRHRRRDQDVLDRRHLAGDFTVSSPSSWTAKVVAATVPNATLVAPVNPDPYTVTEGPTGDRPVGGRDTGDLGRWRRIGEVVGGDRGAVAPGGDHDQIDHAAAAGPGE